MRVIRTLFLCSFLSIFSVAAYGQNPSIQPVHVSAGSVLTFYSQTRLSPGSGNALDALPRWTALRVKLLESIDSRVDRDGFEFRGTLVSPLAARDEILVHPDAEVRGLLVLLRSRMHPDGFRYELLITSVSERGKSYELTASLNPSFLDANNHGSHSSAPSAPLKSSMTKATENKN